MSTEPRRIAILFHETDSEHSVPFYVISLMADCWREDGHEVIFLFGVSEFIPADLVIVHVDLSVVPEQYLEFARRYPMAINGQVNNIRKSTFSTNRVTPMDSYEGKVIVKSDLNSAGQPERRRVYGPHALPFRGPLDYRIYNHANEVPMVCYSRPDLVVEKFLPEMEDGLYCVRNFQFLGDHTFCMRLKSKSPIVNGNTHTSMEEVEPDPAIVAMRHKLKFDYGKFDYVVVDEKPILLDVNKTVGAGGRLAVTPRFKQLRRFRAEGLYSYFQKLATTRV